MARVPRQAVHLNNNEILVTANGDGRIFSEIFSVKSNSMTFSKVSVAALEGFEIRDAVCISDNKIVASGYANSCSREEIIISFTKDAVPAVQELQYPHSPLP